MAQTPEQQSYKKFADAYAKLQAAISAITAQISNGTISAARATSLIKQNLETADKLYNEVRNYRIRNERALKQQELLGPFDTIITNIDDRQKEELEALEKQVRYYGVAKKKLTESEAQLKFKEIKAAFDTLKRQVVIAEDRCASGFKKEADAAFAAILGTGGGGSGGGFPDISSRLLTLEREAREAGLTNIVTEVGLFNVRTVPEAVAELDKARKRCSRKLTVSQEPGLSDLANTFQNLQAQAEIASNNCDLDANNKDAALNSMELVYRGYEDLAKTISELRKSAQAAKNTTLDQQLQTIAEQVKQAIEDLKVAQKRCQESGAAPDAQGLQGQKEDTRAQQALQDAYNAKLKNDWRVRITLAPMAEGYLYRVPPDQAGILAPLQQTDGVIFPYTPEIGVNYTAKYDAANPIHSNYLIPQYQSSAVDNVTINGEFTAQDTREANYLLAVIHFFRSASKMFYGQDENPKPGIPPPILYLYGLGAYQFDNHPMVLTNFTYQLPSDVDYIRATPSLTTPPGSNKGPGAPRDNTNNTSLARMSQSETPIAPGGNSKPTDWNNSRIPAQTTQPTYVPTRIRIQLQFYPIVSRYDVSKNFSFKDYATGKLLQGSKNYTGGMW